MAARDREAAAVGDFGRYQFGDWFDLSLLVLPGSASTLVGKGAWVLLDNKSYASIPKDKMEEITFSLGSALKHAPPALSSSGTIAAADAAPPPMWQETSRKPMPDALVMYIRSIGGPLNLNQAPIGLPCTPKVRQAYTDALASLCRRVFDFNVLSAPPVQDADADNHDYFASPNNALDVHFLDVGRGDGVFVVFPASDSSVKRITMLINLGSRNDRTAGTSRSQSLSFVSDYLMRMKPQHDEFATLDYLVLTHPEADAQNLLSLFLSGRIRLRNCSLSGTAADYPRDLMLRIKALKPLMREVNKAPMKLMSVGRAHVHFLAHNSVVPLRNSDSNKSHVDASATSQDQRNANSSVISIRVEVARGVPERTVLICGGANASTAAFLTKSCSDLLPSDVLWAPRLERLPEAFLKLVSPSLAFITGDSRNGFFEPRSTSLRTLEGACRTVTPNSDELLPEAAQMLPQMHGTRIVVFDDAGGTAGSSPNGFADKTIEATGRLQTAIGVSAKDLLEVVQPIPQGNELADAMRSVAKDMNDLANKTSPGSAAVEAHAKAVDTAASSACTLMHARKTAVERFLSFIDPWNNSFVDTAHRVVQASTASASRVSDVRRTWALALTEFETSVNTLSVALKTAVDAQANIVSGVRITSEAVKTLSATNAKTITTVTGCLNAVNQSAKAVWSTQTMLAGKQSILTDVGTKMLALQAAVEALATEATRAAIAAVTASSQTASKSSGGKASVTTPSSAPSVGDAEAAQSPPVPDPRYDPMWCEYVPGKFIFSSLGGASVREVGTASGRIVDQGVHYMVRCHTLRPHAPLYVSSTPRPTEMARALAARTAQPSMINLAS